MKNNFRHLFLVAICCAVLLSSCITPKRVNYLQDLEQGSLIELENKFEARISTYDELDIYISCMNQDLALPFNIYGQNNGIVERGYYNNRGGYLVDVNGNIQMPVLGELHVAGLTRLKLQDTITALLIRGNYLDDPFVRVRFNNFKIFFLGADGGKSITINNERCTFLEALALSGDLSVYTRRDKIAVMREVDGKLLTRYLDPRSSSVFNDPFFMLQQNDFIITQSSNLGTTRSEISYWLNWVSMGVSVVSLATSLLVYGVIKNK